MVTASQQLGSYLLGDPIGRSALAVIHNAEHTVTGRPAVLKIVHRYFATEGEALRSFMRELQSVKDLRHPNIVALEEFGMDGASAWLAQEPVDGVSLRETEPPFNPEIVSGIVDQLASALEYAHSRGILHRDIAPGNVIISADGVVKLTDFGMATLGIAVHPLMRIGQSTPVPAFMSPEQIEGEPLTPASDTYALGALAYWLLTGGPPHPGDQPEIVLARQLNAAPPAPSRVAPDLTREIDAVVLKVLSPYVASRLSTPGEFAGALRQAVGLASPHVLAGAFAPGAYREMSDADALIKARRMQRESDVEDSFRRIWSQQVVDRRRVALIMGMVGTLTAVLVAWWWWDSYGPKMYLPPPATTLTVPSAPGSWPMHRGDVARTGVTSIDPQFRGEVRWTFRTSQPILASPVVVDGMVYMPVERQIVALDAVTGAVRWTVPATGPVDSTPAFVDGKVYVGLRDGRMLCIDAKTGVTRWEYETKNPIFGSPTVANGTLFFGAGDNRLYAIDAETGAFRWSFETGGWVVSSPAVWENMVIFHGRDGWVYFLDQNNGERLFVFSSRGATDASPAIVDGKVFVPNEQKRFWALKTTERSTFMDRRIYSWHTQLFFWGMSPPPPPPKGALWAKRTPGRMFGSPAVSTSAIYAGTDDGSLYSWDHAGKELWKAKPGGPLASSPVLAGNTLYVGSDDKRLYALDASTGQQRWSFATEGRIRGSVAVTPDTLYVASQDGVLYALR